MADTKGEERDEKRNANNMTMDTFIQSPVTTKTPRKKTNYPNKRRIPSNSLAETVKGFNRFMLQSTINDSTDYHSNKNDAGGDPKINQLVDTHTSNRNERKFTDTDTTNINSQHKILFNRLIPVIILVVIPSINQMTADRVAASGGNLHAVRTVI